MYYVIIQHIESVWSKRSRGGPGARDRNSVPDGVRIPTISEEGRYILHHATFSEHNTFAQSDRKVATDSIPALELKAISFEIDREQLSVRLLRDGNNAVAQSTKPFKVAFSLKPKTWGRIVYNGRFSCCDSGNWWYEKHVYNIGWFDDWASSVFLRGDPQAEFREVARLW